MSKLHEVLPEQWPMKHVRLTIKKIYNNKKFKHTLNGSCCLYPTYIFDLIFIRN